ncbi:MAG: sensor domain-containing diguanylate cyclase [bacterium]|nr:sensor domain-containing diguanylate cyclase [bacterium]MDT8365714.1 sensor domain-containing diguanylate cyclase [bacterium]
MDSQSELDLIRAILEKVNTTSNSEKTLGFALQGIQDSFKCLAAAIILVDARAESFKVVTARGWGYEFLKKFHTSPFQGLVKEMATHWEPILIARNDSRKNTDGYIFQHDFNTLLALPLSIRGKPAGLFYLSWGEEVVVDEELRKRLTDMARLCTLILDHGSLDDKVFSMTNIDPLTGLFSFKFWHEELHREIMRAEKLKSCVAMMMINLNRFKEFNTMYGHVKGDDLLVEVSEAINSQLGKLDVPCRVGAKWYVLLVGDDEQAAKSLAERIIKSFGILSSGGSSDLNLSIGLSVYRAGEEEKTLIERVEGALLEARRMGANSCQIR